MAHTYSIDQVRIDAMLKALTDNGATVMGGAAGPWDVDTHNHGVKLHAEWNTQILTVLITDKAWYVPEGKVWETIDPLIKHIQSAVDENIPA